ncbi:hypothetical protein DPMN_022893 [Dreissena polymorpha]|uniref:Uncharacterized protein n=1 Tax=Dreissena polymorpha TaxID=45954 RepID=A0A9D4LL85_DREPO|nr:hypothetical protein DPMN_022893 [Dreissena polymorpha]
MNGAGVDVMIAGRDVICCPNVVMINGKLVIDVDVDINDVDCVFKDCWKDDVTDGGWFDDIILCKGGDIFVEN